MDARQNRDRLIQLLSERVGIPPHEVIRRLPVVDDLDVDMDSLDLEELALDIEEEFGEELGDARSATGS